MDKFSKKLRHLMDIKGINQPELAKLSGVDQSLISRYLRGDVKAKFPSFENLLALANGLKVTLFELTGSEILKNLESEAEKITDITDEEKQILEAYMKLKDTDPRKKAIDAVNRIKL